MKLSPANMAPPHAYFGFGRINTVTNLRLRYNQEVEFAGKFSRDFQEARSRSRLNFARVLLGQRGHEVSSELLLLLAVGQRLDRAEAVQDVSGLAEVDLVKGVSGIERITMLDMGAARGSETECLTLFCSPCLPPCVRCWRCGARPR